MMNSYDYLKGCYESATRVTDPLEFAVRQKYLTYAIADYILKKDNPDKFKDDDEDDE